MVSKVLLKAAVVPIVIEMIAVPTFPHVIGNLGYVPISAHRSLQVQMKRLTISEFKKNNLPWKIMYVLQTEEVTIRQHLEILAT